MIVARIRLRGVLPLASIHPHAPADSPLMIRANITDTTPSMMKNAMSKR